MSLNTGLSYLKCIVSIATRNVILKNVDRPTKSIISQLLLNLDMVKNKSLDTELLSFDQIYKLSILNIHEY